MELLNVLFAQVLCNRKSQAFYLWGYTCGLCWPLLGRFQANILAFVVPSLSLHHGPLFSHPHTNRSSMMMMAQGYPANSSSIADWKTFEAVLMPNGMRNMHRNWTLPRHQWCQPHGPGCATEGDEGVRKTGQWRYWFVDDVKFQAMGHKLCMN